jgi:hypothetical protein
MLEEEAEVGEASRGRESLFLWMGGSLGLHQGTSEERGGILECVCKIRKSNSVQLRGKYSLTLSSGMAEE